jgi:hypothetical protein
MKVMAAAIVLLMAGIAALGWQLRSEIHADRRMTEEIHALGAKLADKSRREVFELQKECGAQAAKVYSESGFRSDKYSLNNSFESYYNRSTNKCFVFIANFGPISPKGGKPTMGKGYSEMLSYYLVDANTNREYAEAWIDSITSVKEGQRRDVVLSCSLMPLHDLKKSCRTKDTFDIFVALHMGGIPPLLQQ